MTLPWKIPVSYQTFEKVEKIWLVETITVILLSKSSQLYFSSRLANMHRCDSCGREYANNKALKRHVADVHLATRSFTCDLCDKKFKKKSHLNEHMDSIHLLITINAHECKICGASFKRPSHLKEHELHIHSLDSVTSYTSRLSHLSQVTLVTDVTNDFIARACFKSTTTLCTYGWNHLSARCARKRMPERAP